MFGLCWSGIPFYTLCISSLIQDPTESHGSVEKAAIVLFWIDFFGAILGRRDADRYELRGDDEINTSR